MNRLRTLSLSLLLAVAAAGFAAAPNKPKSVIHVITIQWKAGATQNQIQNAIRAAENINYPGLKNVWTKPIKMQLPEEARLEARIKLPISAHNAFVV